jgi:hypothetical protein
MEKKRKETRTTQFEMQLKKINSQTKGECENKGKYGDLVIYVLIKCPFLVRSPWWSTSIRYQQQTVAAM